jgi:hypothetical protein
VARLVEPYELVFKQRQDGLVKEYFFAYDLVGGGSGPGIKAFWPERVQSVGLTDQTFEPRFPIALTKDGGASGGIFGGPFPSGPRPWTWGRGRGARTSAADYPYRVRCPYCNKVFRRQRPTTRLNPHKDGYGNRCYGRVGVLV